MYSFVQCADCQYCPFNTFKSSGGFVPAQCLYASIGSVVLTSVQFVRSSAVRSIVVSALIFFFELPTTRSSLRILYPFTLLSIPEWRDNNVCLVAECALIPPKDILIFPLFNWQLPGPCQCDMIRVFKSLLYFSIIFNRSPYFCIRP